MSLCAEKKYHHNFDLNLNSVSLNIIELNAFTVSTHPLEWLASGRISVFIYVWLGILCLSQLQLHTFKWKLSFDSLWLLGVAIELH